jgi:hypothetical protein
MTSNRKISRVAYALSATLVLGSTATWAADAAKPQAADPAPVMLAQEDGSPAEMGVRGTSWEPLGFNPIERGVRKAAADGPTALRRYVQCTEPIYHFSYWDFAKLLPKE